MRIDELSFWNGKEYFVTRPELLASIFAAIINTQEARLRKPGLSIASRLRREFCSEGWARKIPVSEGKMSSECFDLFRARVAVAIEFSDATSVYREFACFLAAYKANRIDVGILITNAREKIDRCKLRSGRPNVESVRGELGQLKSTLTVPIWIIGLK
ncbi:MAG TPA: BglII/BstYI family type II restriction endonuclease [Candidatus Sulfotelmatobacter sp.]|nr:BglII/BstYI family type II restriction endonuclease [Candidatus Sulfotelmatobacter sp.]